MEASGSRMKTSAVSSMDLAWFEGSDFLLDMEIRVPNKKRRRGRVDTAENGKLDVHYLEFLERLEDFGGAKFGVDGEVEEDDDEDPDYMCFLDHLKEHGNAYICDLSVENGVLSPIVYEDGDYCPSEVKRKTARMCIDSHDARKMWKLKQDGDGKSRKGSYGTKNNSRGEIRNKVNVVDTRVKSPDFEDDCAQVFKDRWKTTMPSKNSRVKKDRSLDVDDDQRLGSKRSGLEKKTSEVDECYAEFIKNLHVEGEDVFWDYGDYNRIYYEPRNQQGTVFEDEPFVKRKACQTLKPSPRLPSPPPKTLITSVKTTLSNSESVRYEYDEEQINETITDYRKELGEYLRKPYDQEEYDILLEIFSARKPMSIHKETRSGGFDQEGPMGKSYLDNNKDLRSEIESARLDRGKVLNLLRMFNFYLQKLPLLQTVQGHTKPWKDEFFKAILPGSSNES